METKDKLKVAEYWRNRENKGKKLSETKRKQSIDEFDLINILNKLQDFKLITDNQRHRIMSKNRKLQK